MGGYSAKCAYCGKWFLQPGSLGEHKRGAHNVGGHRGGVPDRQDLERPHSGLLLPLRTQEEANHALACAKRLEMLPGPTPEQLAVAVGLRQAAELLAGPPLPVEPEPVVRAVYNPHTGLIGCPILQAASGGSTAVSKLFAHEHWELCPEPGQAMFAATAAQWQLLAEQTPEQRVAKYRECVGA